MDPREDRQETLYDYDRATKPRPGSPLTLRGFRIGDRFAEYPLWPVVTVLAIAFIWAVNTISPGLLSFITGSTFIDSVILGVVIGALYLPVKARRNERDRVAARIMADCAREKKAAENDRPTKHD